MQWNLRRPDARNMAVGAAVERVSDISTKHRRITPP
jgi:hypothetical protein